MYALRFFPAVDAQIEETLAFTLERFGPVQYREYAELIEGAFAALEQDPLIGRERPDILEGARIYHIAQRGRGARHIVVYHVLEEEKVVEVVAFLHDAMDLTRTTWP